MDLVTISRRLAQAVDKLQFSSPVTHVYNPLVYAQEPHEMYLQRYGCGQHDVLLLGMNPGPFGMAQTGVPFGDVTMVRDWLGLEASVEQPANENPRRPITGFSCQRHEVSGTRLWGWARDRWETPDQFFARFFVANYCPLVFMEESGKNRTPDKLPAAEREALYAACDEALRQTVQAVSPKYAIGVGDFARKRLEAALTGFPVTIATILHPSPANPKANLGWATQVDCALHDFGIL